MSDTVPRKHVVVSIDEVQADVTGDNKDLEPRGMGQHEMGREGVGPNGTGVDSRDNGPRPDPTTERESNKPRQSHDNDALPESPTPSNSAEEDNIKDRQGRAMAIASALDLPITATIEAAKEVGKRASQAMEKVIDTIEKTVGEDNVGPYGSPHTCAQSDLDPIAGCVKAGVDMTGKENRGWSTKDAADDLTKLKGSMRQDANNEDKEDVKVKED